MGAKTRVHNIRDIFHNRNLLEGAIPVKQEDGTFAVKNFTIIKAGMSGNRNFYSEKVLSKANKVFEGKDIRTDHPSFFENQSVKDVVGRVTKTWYSRESKAIKGNALFSSTAEDILTKVKEGFIGDLSINARGKTTQEEAPDGKVRRVVDSIDEGFSVDLVCDAAAGGSLHEDYRKNSLACERMRRQMEDLDNLTEEELRKSRSDLVESIEKKAIESMKEDKSENTEDPPSSMTKDEVKSIFKEQIGEFFDERDKKAETAASSAQLEESITKAVEKALDESDVDDKIKSFVKEGLMTVCREKFKSIEDIDEKVLFEDRDAKIDEIVSLSTLGEADGTTTGDGKANGDGKKKTKKMIDFMPS